MKPAPPPDHVLTDEQVAMFWEAIRHWQRELGLQDWRITHSMRGKPGTMAMMDKWDWPQRQVRCRLNRNWKSSEPTPDEISKTACHEMLHVLFHPLISAARDPRTLDDDLQAIEHGPINLLERLLTE